MTTNQTRLKTPDLYFAAALIVLGAKLTATNRAGNRVYWYFDEVDEEWPNAWLMDTLVVHAKEYSESVRSLKSMVHGEGL